jgi:hypothetical protein
MKIDTKAFAVTIAYLLGICLAVQALVDFLRMVSGIFS